MSFIRPMNAAPFPDNFKFAPKAWVAEKKFDGERLIVQVGGGPPKDLFTGKLVLAWARSGLARELPEHLVRALSVLPDAVYDGELCVEGGKCYDVKRLTMEKDRQYIIFDVLELMTVSTIAESYDTRRAYLEEIFSREHITKLAGVVDLAESWPLSSVDEIHELKNKVWNDGGEGLILKRRAARYTPGKRPKDFIKIKKKDTAVLTVIGFEPSKGKIVDRGPFGTTVIQDEDGNITTVKTLNDFELDRLEKMDTPGVGIERRWETVRVVGKGVVKMHTNHPAVGWKLRIEFQERTIDGSYREPRWDRWEHE